MFQDGDGTVEEGVDLLESGAPKEEKTDKPEKNEGRLRATLTRGLDSIAARNPFSKKESQNLEPVDAEAGDQPTPRPTLLQRIKLPNVNVFSKSNKEQVRLFSHCAMYVHTILAELTYLGE